MRSFKALAEVRRLMGPVVQVNVADRQVNVAGNVTIGGQKSAS